MKQLVPQALPLPWVLVATLGGLAAVGVLDYVTGVEVRILPLYFVPVAFSAWYARARWAWLLAPTSGMTWVVSNGLAGVQYSQPFVWVINFATQTMAFGFVALLIAQLRRRLELERKLGRVDALTSLPNSRAFHERAEWLFAQARRHGFSTTLAYLDVDCFKGINDRYGHQRGDDVLREIAAVLRQHTRTSDLSARLGGDEFVFLLTHTSPDGTEVLLQRLRVMLAGALSARGWPVTVSIGAASFTRPPDSVDAALDRADSLMYAAKQAGGNQLCLEIVERANDAAPASLAHSYS